MEIKFSDLKKQKKEEKTKIMSIRKYPTVVFLLSSSSFLTGNRNRIKVTFSPSGHEQEFSPQCFKVFQNVNGVLYIFMLSMIHWIIRRQSGIVHPLN